MAFQFFIQSKSRPKNRPRRHCYVVEGEDDAVFLDKLLSILGHDPADACVLEIQGRDNLPGFLEVFSKEPEVTSGRVESIAIMFDADDDFEDAQKFVQDALGKAGLARPPAGQFLDTTAPKIGLYLFPGNGQSGVLEDLFIEMLGDDHRIAVAENAVAQIVARGVRLDKLSKRKMQTILAISTPGLASGIGRGLRNEALSLEVDNIAELRDFVNAISGV